MGVQGLGFRVQWVFRSPVTSCLVGSSAKMALESTWIQVTSCLVGSSAKMEPKGVPKAVDDFCAICRWIVTKVDTFAFASGHTRLNTPDPIRTRKLSG